MSAGFVRAFTSHRQREPIRRVLEKACARTFRGISSPGRFFWMGAMSSAAQGQIMQERAAGPPRGKSQRTVIPRSCSRLIAIIPFHLGENLYGRAGVSHVTTKSRRLPGFAQNYQFFRRAAGAVPLLDSRMGQPQWSRSGMFLAEPDVAAA